MFRERTIQEVLRIIEVLKSQEANPQQGSEEGKSGDALSEALEELMDFCIDRVVLERTSIAKEVRKLQKHSDSVVAQRAEALCETWRKDYEVRKKVVEGFMDKGTLKKRDARDLEEGLFNCWCPLGLLEGDGYEAYKTHYKRLCTHLRSRGNGSLVQRLQDSAVDYAEAAALPDEELLSDEKKQLQIEAKEEGFKAAMAGGPEPEGTVTEEYTCPKCMSTKTAYREVQTGWHSDQQDLTVLVKCLDCGARWKASDDHGLAA